MDEFNKRCAEALGWGKSDNGGTEQCLIPTWFRHLALNGYGMGPYGIRMGYSKLHFHDSYDWAMLLLKKCGEERWCSEDIPFDHLDLFTSTPQQISQAALEVLEEAECQK